MPLIPIADFETRTPALINWVRQLAEIESPSTDKAAVDRLGDVLARALRGLGAAVVEDPQTTAGNNLIGRWGAGAEAGLVILAHMDTVHELGSLARMPVREAEGRLYGPGVIDMKASLAMTLVALQALRESKAWPDRPVTVLFTSDEEIGSERSRPLIERSARGAALVLCLEPCLPDGSLKTERKGIGGMRIAARGRATHAGADHENGRNAIEELAHHVLAAQQLTDYSRGTTVSVGVVRGGTRSNVVPEEAWAEADFRVAHAAEAERLEAWMRSRVPVTRGTTVTVTGGLNRPPMPRDAVMARTFGRAQQIAAQLGITLGEGSTGGGSDANFVAPLGVPVLDGLGALGNGAHSEREHVVISSLPERAALLAALLSAW
ncbi:MAG: M20 family metallopeptidase [Anaerolineales bacterium]|nr:M20 family metallopeptidase [Anaerolineales bacterium]